MKELLLFAQLGNFGLQVRDILTELHTAPGEVFNLEINKIKWSPFLWPLRIFVRLTPETY